MKAPIDITQSHAITPGSTLNGGPTQTRSLASLQRMIAAARDFMLKRGNEEFTLQEVSRAGKVSIGSIYHRFAGKEDLVRAVIAAELAHIAVAETRMIEGVLAKSKSLTDYVPRFVVGFAENLRKHSLMMRLAMQRASFDAQMLGTGNRSALQAATKASKAMLTFRSEIAGDADTKARITFQMIFATLARHLSLDTRDPMAMNEDWQLLVDELSWMALSYLIGARPSDRLAGKNRTKRARSR